MNKEQLNNLKKFVRKVGSYKLPEPPKKPEKQHSKKELEQAYVYRNGKIEEV